MTTILQKLKNIAEAKEYNGWYNYNVWNVMLYIGNEQYIYESEQEVFKDYFEKKISVTKFKQKVNQIGARAKMISDIKNEKLTKREIIEIRKGIVRDYKEYAQYRKRLTAIINKALGN
jgi:hypothetical protein